MAGIAGLRLPISDLRLPITDGHWKEVPHHFFNRQSAISNRQLSKESLHEVLLCMVRRAVSCNCPGFCTGHGGKILGLAFRRQGLERLEDQRF
jgi:hypothetical protein